jgi:hypothetical protein
VVRNDQCAIAAARKFKWFAAITLMAAQGKKMAPLRRAQSSATISQIRHFVGSGPQAAVFYK